MWGDDSPLCLFCLDGDLLALSYRSASFLRGSSPPLSAQLHLHGNQSFCRSGIRLGEGEKSLISSLLIHANNATQQPKMSQETERQHTFSVVVRVDGCMSEVAQGRRVTHETFHLRGFFSSVSLENED